jgi:hypothetical protein
MLSTLRPWRGVGDLRGTANSVEFYLHLAAALVTLRMLIRHATIHYRWDRRPTTRRLK